MTHNIMASDTECCYAEFCDYLNVMQSVIMLDKLKKTGIDLGCVFNSRSGRKPFMHLLRSLAKRSNLELKTRPEQVLGSQLLRFQV